MSTIAAEGKVIPKLDGALTDTATLAEMELVQAVVASCTPVRAA